MHKVPSSLSYRGSAYAILCKVYDIHRPDPQSSFSYVVRVASHVIHKDKTESEACIHYLCMNVKSNENRVHR
jgi:hypothetical protein